MNVLLEEPTAVLVVDDPFGPEGDREWLLDGAASAVVDVARLDEATAALDDRVDVGCVVTPWSLPDVTGIELCEAVAEGEPDVGVVVVDEESDDAHARRALNAGASGYVTPDDSPERVRDRVDDVLDDAVRRQVQAEESDAFRTIFDEIRIPMYVKDEEGRHLRTVDMPEGADPDEARGKTDLELFGDEDPELARQTYADDMAVIESERPVVDHDERFTGDDYDYWSRTTKVPWFDENGEVKGLVGASRDVTEFKRCERELEQLRERFDQFANYLSHDLQNPLQVASGNLELARETGDERALEKVATALDRIDEIVDDLGALAKTGRYDETGLPRADLRATVEDVWSVVATGAATLDVRFGAEARINEPEGAFRSALDNLLSNAVAHGGEDVTVRVGRTDDGGIYVADDGPGIPAEKRDEVLELGYTTAGEGTGTGLGIVADVATQNDWRLEIGDSWAGGARIEIEDCLVVWDEATFREKGVVDLDAKSAVGELEAGPSADYDADRDAWTVRADGENVWANTNEFYFVHAEVSRPVRITGRVADVDHVDQFSKAGLMIRDGLDEDASYGAVALSAGRGTELLWRTERGTDGRSYQLDDTDDPISTYRAEWDGETVRLSVSGDGEEWIETAQWPIDADDTAVIGLFASSVVKGHPTTATFESVEGVELADAASNGS